MIVLPVRIIMSPTSSSMFFAGRKARSATLRTTLLPWLWRSLQCGRRRRRLFHRPYEAQTRTVSRTCAEVRVARSDDRAPHLALALSERAEGVAVARPRFERDLAEADRHLVVATVDGVF